MTKLKYHNDHDVDSARAILHVLFSLIRTRLSLSHCHSPTNSLFSFRDYFTHTLRNVDNLICQFPTNPTKYKENEHTSCNIVLQHKIKAVLSHVNRVQPKLRTEKVKLVSEQVNVTSPSPSPENCVF